MSSDRWLNLFLWGLGDRMDGTNDLRSDLLLVTDLLLWIGIASFLVLEGPRVFIAFWLLAPLTGQPVYWIGTQLIIGYFMTRATKPPQSPQPTEQARRVEGKGAPVQPGPSEEP